MTNTICWSKIIEEVHFYHKLLYRKLLYRKPLYRKQSLVEKHYLLNVYDVEQPLTSLTASVHNFGFLNRRRNDIRKESLFQIAELIVIFSLNK